MFQKKKTKVDLGNGNCRYRTVWYSDPCQDRESAPSIEALRHLLVIVSQQRENLICGQQVFEKAKITHDGSQWVIEMEGIENV